MSVELNSGEVLRIQSVHISDYHDKGYVSPHSEVSALLQAVEANAESNIILWHLEDDARMEDVPNQRIAEIKRAIDINNQKRNDRIERIDELLQDELPSLSKDELISLPINSETPGSIIDRLCIANLKIYHMEEETRRTDAGPEHVEKCREKLAILRIQVRDLTSAFDLLVDELSDKKKQLRIYRQFKMYNDPALNPSLYTQNKG